MSAEGAKPYTEAFLSTEWTPGRCVPAVSPLIVQWLPVPQYRHRKKTPDQVSRCTTGYFIGSNLILCADVPLTVSIYRSNTFVVH